ncbi:hypothetical protein AgCh_001205 [Apium graveolens]
MERIKRAIHFNSLLAVDSQGMSGGLALLWRDKRGGALYPEWLIEGFNEALGDTELVDLDLVGHQFMWEKIEVRTHGQSRYETIRVPILRPSEYPIWKVKMAMFLEATNPEYLDRINEGPHKPTKLSVVVADQPAKTIPKEKAKEIWDALETRCQGTDAIKKNMRTILTQEYEHFDSKADESLTDLYDRFVKLLNDLSLVDKEYDLEDSNLKFLLALPENWDLKSTTIRDNYNITETTLAEIYGMLKNYKLEMNQRSKRHGRKSRTIALKAEEKSFKVVASKRSKGKALIIKSDSESSNSDDDDSETKSLPEMDADEEMMKLCALMVKGITKKGKSDKGKALVTKKKSWTDTSDFENEENYALMVNAYSSPETVELKVPQTTYAFNTNDITELRLYLKTMFISYKDQTLTCERLTSENLAFKKRNDYLEKELVFLHQTKKERDDAFSGNWKEGLGYGDDKSEKGTEQIEPIIVKQTAKPKVNPVKFVAKTVNADYEKMKQSRTEVKEKSTSDKLKQDKPAEVNIGLMTK